MNTTRKLKLDFFNIALYLISPILAIPAIIFSLIKRTKYSIVNYSLLISFISFCFIPEVNWDKVRHIEFYEYVKNMSLSQFFIYNFSESPDFIFRYLLYFGASLGIRVHIIFFLVTFITIYLVMRVYEDFLNQLKYNKNYILLLIPIFILSFSYQDIISGFRYALGASLTFYGIYFGLIRKQSIKAIIFISLGVFTHFSVLLFALLYFIYPLVNRIPILITKIFLILSFLFILIPQETFIQFIDILGIGGALLLKASIYLDKNSFEEVSGLGAVFIAFFNVIWIYILNILLVVKNSSNNTYYRFLIWSLIFTNIFVSFPIIYNRYALFLKFIIVLYLSENLVKKKQIKVFIMYLFMFGIIAINQFIIMRNGYFDIFLNYDKWIFLYQIFENDFSSSDIYIWR